ncbi:MAG: prephenate dehydrogenase [Thermodesulfobacteriota bacterium]
MTTDIHFDTVAVIGVGLIGGSLAMVMRQRGLAARIVGVGRGQANLDAALRLGVVDSATRDLAEGVRDADLVVVATPVLKIADTVRRAAPSLRPGCIVTDAGSVKAAIIDEIEPVMPEGVSFVPGHPIAGTENSGVEAAFPALYQDRVCILTPTERTDRAAVEAVRRLWEEAGSRVVIMDPALHDRVLAAVSHLPHMIAYTLVNTVADLEDSGTDALSFSAGGFKDFTRIASSSPEMWADICALNRDRIVEMIGLFQDRLAELKGHIEKADVDALNVDFSRAKMVRDSLLAKNGE